MAEAGRQGPITRRLAAALALGLGLLAALGGTLLSMQPSSEKIAIALTGGDPAKAPPLLRRYGCGGCHTISALAGADGKVAPSLDHLRQRVYIAGVLPNTAENLLRWIVAPQTVSPDAAMPNTGITEPEARDVAAFLYAN